MENNNNINSSQALENLRCHRDQYVAEIKRRKKQTILTKARALNSLILNKNGVPSGQHENEVFEKIDRLTFEISEIGAVLEATYSTNELKKLYGFAGIYRLLFSESWNVETARLLVMTPNIASHLADSLKDVRLVSPIISCLANRIQDLENSVIKKSGIPLLLELRAKIREVDSLKSVLCEMSNLSYYSTEFRDAFLERDTMKILIRMAETENVKEISDIVRRAIFELCCGHPLPTRELIEPALPIVWDAIKSNTEQKEEAVNVVELNVQAQNRRAKFVPIDILSILIEDLKNEKLIGYFRSNRMSILDTVSPEVPASVLVLIDIVDKSQNQKMPQCDIFIIVKKILTLFPEQIEDILKNSEAKNTLFSIAFKENYFKEGKFKNELRYIFALMAQKVCVDGWKELKERGILIILESCLNSKEPTSLIEATLKGITNLASFDKNLLEEKIIDINVRELMSFESLEIRNERTRIFNYLQIVKDL